MYLDLDILGWTWKPVWILNQDFKLKDLKRSSPFNTFQEFQVSPNVTLCHTLSGSKVYHGIASIMALFQLIKPR